jgi:hypothetical protein
MEMRAKALGWRGFRGSERRAAAFLLTIIVCAFVVTGAAHAGSSFLGSPVGLQNLTNGQSLVVGDKVFSDFFISGDISANQVTVTPIEDSFGYGISFSGGFVAVGLGDETEDMVLGYTVAVVTNSPNLISDVHLRFNGSSVGLGSGGWGLASVTEQVFGANLALVDQMAVFAFSSANQTTNQLENTLLINPPRPKLVIHKDVLLRASGGFATISIIDQTFSQIPEPSTLGLVSLGLTGLYLLLRRFRTRR